MPRSKKQATENLNATEADTEENATEEVNTSDVGPTYLFKDGKSQVFEGQEVGKAMKSGWKDAPQPVDSGE